MGDALGRAAGLLARRLQKLQGIKATYYRGGYSFTVYLVPSGYDAESLEVDEASGDSYPADWQIDPAELVDRDGNKFLPDRGDAIEIKHYQSLVDGLYDVLPRNGQHWTPVDNTGRMIFIHTKKAPE